MQANVLTLAYRKDLFDDPANQKAYKDKTGKDLAPPKDWDEFAAIAALLHRREQASLGHHL